MEKQTYTPMFFSNFEIVWKTEGNLRKAISIK